MDAERAKTWVRGAVFAAIALELACGGGPGGGGGGGVTLGTPTPEVEVAGTPSPKLKSFTAAPSTITHGDTFALAWEGDGGTVALSTRGGVVFASGRQSTGSETMRPGVAGYPGGAGTITYQARNSDVARPLEVVVTVNSPAPGNRAPAVTVTGGTCHPRHWTPESCSATCTATASDADGDKLSYAWGGCATGTASTATCAFSQPAAATCSVTVSDGKGGGATASAAAAATNAAPGLVDPYWQWSGTPHDYLCALCEAKLVTTPVDDDPDAAHSTTCHAVLASDPMVCTLAADCYLTAGGKWVILVNTSNRTSNKCKIDVTLTDDWGASTTTRYEGTIT